jgi:hypothetical protein
MKRVSECCLAKVKIRSSSPWIRNPKYRATNWYECSCCGQPCDTIEKEGEGDERQTGKPGDGISP